MRKSKQSIRTMQEFSEYAGVSRPTVSKFFNDPASVKANTREKLELAARKLNFQPNMLAVNFKKKKTNLIGVIIPDATDPFYASLTQQVTQIANESGLITMVFSSDGDSQLQARYLTTIMGMQVAGVVIVPTGNTANQQDISEQLSSVPTIFVDSQTHSANHFVGSDNVQSFTLMIEYLVRSGSAPCYFPMPHVNSNAQLREDTYSEVMKTLGYEPKIVSVDENQSWKFEAFAYEQTKRILSNDGFPTDTIFCANDRIAYGVMAACHAAGLTIGRNEGDDIRIAGHDDHPLARYTFPPLTTVRQDTSKIASIATKKLLDMMESESPMPPEKVMLDSTLHLRESA